MMKTKIKKIMKANTLLVFFQVLNLNFF